MTQNLIQTTPAKNSDTVGPPSSQDISPVTTEIVKNINQSKPNEEEEHKFIRLIID